MDKKSKITTAILEAFEDGIYVINQDLIVEYMNSAMIEDFGDSTGKKCHQLMNQSEAKCPWCRSDEVFEGKILRREVYVPLVDKTFYMIETPFRSEDGNMRPFMPGIGIMAIRLRIPVVPVHISGLFEVLSRSDSWPKPGRCAVRMGTALKFTREADPKRVAKRVEEAIRSLSSQETAPY